jgi:ferredoxin
VADDGVAVALKDAGPAGEAALVREAIRRCPADAITLSD